MAFGQNYLNWYLNQANYGMYGSSMGMGGCNYSIGAQMGIMFAEGILGRLLGGGMGGCGTFYNTPMGFGGGYGVGGGYSTGNSSSTSVDTSDIDKEIKELETKKAKADTKESGVDNYSQLNENINTAEGNLADYKKLKENLDKANSKLQNLTDPGTAPVKEESESDEIYNNRVEKYNADKKVYDDAKKAVEDAENALKQKYNNETETTLQDKIDDAKKAKENAINEYKEKIDKEIAQKKQEKQDLQGLTENLNKKDGNFLSRAVDGKDTIKDKMAAFKKASSKYAQNPYSLSKEEVETLLSASTLASSISESDQSETSQSIVRALQVWSKGDRQDTLQMLKSAYNGNISDVATLNKLAQGGFLTKSDRKVGNKTQTVYSGGEHSYIINGESVQSITKTQNGNLFHKAQYQ